MVYNIRPSKHLTDLLSTYLDFDGKQLKLGLWGGDLKIQNVNLKNDAFTPLLNSWKDSEVGQAAGMDIASFLTKEFLIDEDGDPSFASTLDLKLIKGTIGYCRAKIPWQNLLLKNGVETVHIDVRDVTIRLGLESCIAKLLIANNDKKNNVNSTATATGRDKIQKDRGTRTGTGTRVDSKFSRLQGNERLWKQEMIRLAEECISTGKDIPSPAEFAAMKNTFISKLPADTDFKLEEGAKASFLERFVKSFATSIGWRVGKGLKVTMQNIRIIVVHGGVELGLHTDVIDLFEYSHGDDESMNMSVGMSVDTSMSPTRKSKGTHESSQEESDSGDSIRKQVKISNCGVFVREASTSDHFNNASTSTSTPNIEASLDEYVIQPTSIKASLCLRTTGISIQVEDASGEKRPPPRPADESASTVTDTSEETTGKKRRRGKKDKKRKLNDDSESTAFSVTTSSVNYVVETSSSQSMQQNNAHPLETGMSESEHGIDFAESSALFSTKIRMEGITVVTTTRSMELFDQFLRRVVKLKKGRPNGDYINFIKDSIERKRFSRQFLLYTLFCVLKDVRKRKILVEYFYKSGDSFIPSAMRPFRQKYIECYSQSRLNRKKSSIETESESESEYDSFNRGLQEDFLQRMEDTLPVEQIILYRKLAETPNQPIRSERSPKRYKMKSDSAIHVVGYNRNSEISFESDTPLPEVPLPQYLGLHALRRGESSDSTVKAPKHRRNQSLNIDTMNESLDFIPSARQVKYASADLSVISEAFSVEDNGPGNIEAMLQFDKAILQHDKAGNTSEEKYDSSNRSRNVGSVSSSISFVLSELKLFVCEEASQTETDVRNDTTGIDIDEMSTLTANSIDDTKPCSDNFNKGLMILGSPHTISFSSVLLKTKITSYKNLGEESKVNSFSIQGIYCRLRETDILWAGMVQCPSDSDIIPSSKIHLQSIGELSDYQICQNIQTGSPFVRGKLSSKVHTNSTRPSELNVSFAKIFSFADILVAKDILNFVGATKEGSFNFAKMSDKDHVRFQVAKLLAEEHTGGTHGDDIDLHVDIGGLEFTYPITGHNQSDIVQGVIAEETNVIKLTMGDMLLRKGTHVDETINSDCAIPDLLSNSKTVSDFIGILRHQYVHLALTACLTQNIKQVLVFQDLKVSDCNEVALFEIPLNGEFRFSSTTRTHSYCARPEKNVMILVSPISIVLSQDLIQTISLGLDPFREASLIDPSENNFHHGCPIPRLSVFAGLRKLKVQLHLQSFRVAIDCEDFSSFDGVSNAAEQVQRAALGEILSDLLSYLACFPPPYSRAATLEAKSIACGRMSAIGLSTDEAESCMRFAIEHFIQQLDSHSSLARNKKVVNIVGLSPGRFDSKTHTGKIGEIESRLDHLIKTTVDETYAHQWKPKLDDMLELTEALILDIPSSIQLDVERFFYDWKVTGQVKSCNLRNGGGRQLLSLSSASAQKKEDVDVSPSGVTDPQVGLVFTVLQNDERFELGEGGLSFKALSDHVEIGLDRESEMLIQASIGSFQLQFSDIDWTNAAETVSVLTDSFCAYGNEKSNSEDTKREVSSDISFTASLDVKDCQILLCTDEFQPFSKAILNDLSVDIVSNSTLREEKKSMQVIARGNAIRLFDLSPEGQAFEEVLIPQKHPKSTDACFEVRMILSSEPHHFPSELLVVFTNVRLLFLMRFLNELLQYFQSPQYGVGHFLSIHSNPSLDETVHPHPMSFQICLMESSIICPKNSTSDEFIAFESQKIILTSSYERESFSIPSTSRNETVPGDVPMSDSHDFGPPNDLYQENSGFFDCGDLQSDSFRYNDSNEIHDREFDPNSIMRLVLSAEDVRIFTGISQERCEQDLQEDFFYIAHHLEIGRAQHGSEVFRDAGSLPDELFSKKKRTAQLCKRVWEEITLDPVQFEVYADYMSSGVRILIKDQITFDDDDDECGEPAPFNVKLRMSQFYALISMWYGNMQELPILFPYSIQSILDKIEMPACPKSWPEYGTESYVGKMCSDQNKNFEIVVSFAKLVWRCAFDPPDYFSKRLGCAFMIDTRTDTISFEAEGLLLKTDFDDENIMRIGCVSRSLQIQDFRKSTVFEHTFHIPLSKSGSSTGSLNMEWGLGRSMADFTDDLDFPFQFSVFMTPDRWCLANIGMARLDSCTHDLAFFWILLEYFSAYFVSDGFGNPYFEAERQRIEYKQQYSQMGGNSSQMPCLNLDVRLWLTEPRLAIPTNPADPTSRVLVLKTESGGIFYRYKTIDYDFYAQNIVTQNMDILFLSDARGLSTNVRRMKKSDRTTQIITAGLDLNVQYDMHIDTNHMNIFVSTSIPDPCNDELKGIESSHPIVEPLLLPPPTVCHPRFKFSKRSTTLFSCDITMSPEDLQMAGNLLYNFAGPYEPVNEGVSESNSGNSTKEGQKEELSLSATVKLTGIRLVICEPILGMHLPIANIYISELRCTVSDFKIEDCFKKENMDFQGCADAQLWVDYYKSGPTRSWEPLLEPYKCTVLYEKSAHRGLGITVNSETPFHLNISGAFLETFDFATNSFFTSIFKMLEKESLPTTPPSVVERRGKASNTSRGQHFPRMAKEDVTSANGDIISVTHEQVPTLSSEELLAFSLINLTGERIRFHQQNSPNSNFLVGYLDNLDVTALSFPATRSVFRNLKVVEVSSESLDDGEVAPGGQVDSSHYIELQVPGMYWCRAICVDNPGKRFVNLQPRSDAMMAKVQSDWRLANVLSILTEVSSFEGGRQVTLSSPVEVVNKTGHKISLAFHTDPTHFEKIGSDEMHMENRNANGTSNMGCDIHEVEPDETYQVSILLMEAALDVQGKNLGSFWVRPQEKNALELLNSLRGKESVQSSSASIGYCSRPVNILNLVKESSELFKEGSSSPADMNTEYHLFCPIIEESEELISPFCYCIEVKRSPVVSPFPGHGMPSSSVGDVDKSTRLSKEMQLGLESLPEERSQSSSVKKQKPYPTDGTTSGTHKFVHGPVAYSLVIHPPIVIENLLPEPARYEIMHATKRQVVWWSDLKPGESIPIHTVGLDSPLFLMINVGYCRTPVGEGALIHHGSDIIKRVQGQDKIVSSARRMHSDDSFNESSALSESESGVDNVKAAGMSNSPDDFIATSTTVVDSIGQRLNLCIDNKKGSGGQRHITVSCPYWIVNTTEYALQYKQEKSTNLVSGSIKSANKDGSKPVDSSKRNSISDHGFHKTIFPGRPGALFGAKAKVNMHEYTTLLGTDIPLDQIANLAFMFNYGDSHRFGGNERLSLKLVDPLWRSHRSSEWSRGFSLDSVGVTHVVGMHCADGRQLEVAAVVTIADGVLSKYTKIVRICPRYVLINQLPRPIRLWQDSSLVHPSRVLDASKDASRGRDHPNWKHKPAPNKVAAAVKTDDLALCQYDFLFGQPALLDYQPGTNMPNKTVAHESAVYITTAASNDPIPFHLPDTRADRELRVDLGPNWNLSASFPADITSDHTLKLTRVVDLRLLKHVDNRGASKYKVQLPPTDISGSNIDFDGELGLWFETIQWNGSSKCVVKGTKRDKFSYTNTDIHVGDELLAIDGKLVSKMEFAETMKILKERLSEVADACKMKKPKNQKFLKSAQKGRKPKFLKRFDKSFSQGSMGSIAESLATENTDMCSDSNVEIIGGPKVSLTLEFQTLEYRMKKVRDRALRRRKNGVVNKKTNENDNLTKSDNDTDTAKIPQKSVSESSDIHSQNKRADNMQIEVSMKIINQSAFVVVNEANGVAPYRIENRSMKKYIHFRQRACENHPWNALAPGESVNYTWEEPLKPCKLVVRVGNQGVRTTRGKSDSNAIRFKKIESEDHGGFGPSKIVKLDEVGLEGVLPCFDNGNQRDNAMLLCNVDTDGATRVLIISDTDTTQSSDYDTESSRWTKGLGHLQNHGNILTKEIEAEISSLRAWKEKRAILEKDLAMAECDTLPKFSPQLLPTVQEDTETPPSNDDLVQVADFNREVGHYEDTIITRNHQVIVEVIEASGLQSANNSALTGLCSPYCSVRLEDGSKKMRRNVFTKESCVKRTYFIERCSSPKWTGMKFVFDVPASAISDPHGFAVLVKVKDHRLIGRDRPLGRTEIHLRNLRNQKEVIGWFPLISRTGKGSDLANPAAAGRVQGSVKLRAQWIYTLPALLDYYILLSENRIVELRANRDAMTVYYEKMKDEVQKQKDLYDFVFDIKSLSGKTASNLKSSNVQLKSSDGRWTSALKQGMRAQKLRNLWKKQQPNTDTLEGSILDNEVDIQSHEAGLDSVKLKMDMNGENVWSSQFTDSATSGEHLQRMKAPLQVQRRGIAFSEGDLLKDNMHFDASHSSRSASGSIDQNGNIFDALRFLNILKHDSGGFFHHNHMENIIFAHDNMVASKCTIQTNLISWVSAYDILNDRELKHFFIPRSELHKKNSETVRKNINTAKDSPYQTLALPGRATLFMKERNIDFRNKLLISREHFDKAAQRSLMAVLNPGGWLKLRPITALCLHEDKDNKFTGMFVRVRYGSKSRSTSTVDATVTPTWTDDSDMFDDNLHQDAFFRRRENDLEVKIEPLKTSVALQLSVFGTRMNTKVELGVLQIPLAHAISCCTEASENKKKSGSDHKGGIYVRWFPLKDPKDCIGGDGQVSYRPTDVEQTSDDRFSNYMTPCIKLAMWWDPDTPKKTAEPTSIDGTRSKEFGDIGMEGNPDLVTRSLSQRYFHASIDSISAALIDSFKARELLSLTTTDTDIRYSHTKTTTQVGMAMAHLQLDHHDETALEPVILYPRPVPNPQPTIQFLAIKNNVRSKSNLDSFKHIAIALEEMDLRIEETWLFDVWEFVGRFLRRRRHIEKNSILRSSPSKKKSIDRAAPSSFADSSQVHFNEVLDMMNALHQHTVGSDQQRTKQIYIEKLMLAPVKFNISYVKSSRTNENVLQNLGLGLGISGPQVSIGNKRSNEENNVPLMFEIFRQWSESGHDEEWTTTVDERTRHFQNVISAAFPGITDAPIRVNGKVLDNLFKTWDKIIADLQNFYLKEMMFQVYKILGSVDYFGNPTMAVNSIMKGAHDFVVLPFREFIRSPNNPSKLGIGVAKGTLSFLSHFFSGVFGFVSNISEAGGTAAAALSFDEHFKRWHKQQVADHFRHMHGQFRPKGGELILTAIARPLQDLVAGLLFAVSGVLVEPYKGAQLKGMSGFTKGLGVGTVGLVAKPLVGVFDAFAHMSESMHDFSRSANILVKNLNTVKKMRLPYVFGLHKILLPYNSVDACSANLLHLFPLKHEKRSQSEDGEVLILSQLLQRGPGLGWYIVVTTKRIVKFIVRYDASEAPIMEWQVKLNSKVRIVSRVEHCTHNDVLLEIRMIRVPGGSNSSPLKTQNDSIHAGKSLEKAMDEHKKSSNDSPQQNESGSFLTRREKSNPVQHALGAFGTNRNKKRERTTYYVPGDLQTERDALIQVHNAICCLTGQFESVMSRTYNSGVTHGDREGHTSFGPLHFDEKYENNTATQTSECDISDHLDAIPWIYNFDKDKQTIRRSEWEFSDELQASEVMGGGPDWFVEARARATFKPISSASIPSLVDEFEVQWLAENMERKKLSYIDTATESSALHYTERQIDIGSDNGLQLTTVDKAGDASMIFGDNKGLSPIESKDMTMEDRLENVEYMLQRLIQTNMHPLSNVSTVSALTEQLPVHTVDNDRSTTDETDQLRREVEILKKQLAEKDNISETLGKYGSKSKRKRRFKRLWKS